MKFTWTEDDIIPGRYVCKNPDLAPAVRPNPLRSFVPDGHTSKWTYLIGYVRGGPMKEDDAVYALVNIVDGMVCKAKTKPELVAMLNRDGMRPMPHRWVLATVDYLRDCQVES